MVFNLRKKAYGIMADEIGDLILPPGVNSTDVYFLWKNVYENNPEYAYNSPQDMINNLGQEGVEREMASWSNPEKVEEALPAAESMENAMQQMENALASKKYNLKKARKKFAEEDFMIDPSTNVFMEDYSDEFGQDEFGQNEFEDNNIKPPFTTIEDFRKWLDATDTTEVIQQMVTPEGDHLKEAVEQYYVSSDEGEKGQIAAQIFSDPSFPLREEQGIMVQQKSFGEVEKAIKKIAQDTAKKHKTKVFNLSKTAQHKTIDNAILWGPNQSRIDPFLKQPVSDWHIVERNKGFGLVVDDVWNIDYETIWRENIMDKYSRPYKDKDGNWVGGYLNKRFEIDAQVPEENKLQLKPGQIRRPILPEYGNTESRLQAARSKGDIAGANDKTEPFNWKNAQSKKKR
jgi:hypothetical protein